jgi:hypothetical protein
MTLPRFLDCAYTLLFDEYQRLGMDLLTAGEKLQEWQPQRAQPERAETVNVAAKNTQALQELQGMMMGLGKA